MSEESKNQESEVVLTPEEQQAAHDQAMVAKVDAQAANVDTTLQTDQEVMFAGKYKSVEELEKAYEHLQSKMGKPEESAEEPEVPEVTPEAPKEEAEQLVATKGIDYSALESEWQDKGSLSEDTYKQLEDAGIPQNMVDAYIAGQEALTQSAIKSMHSIAGGEAEYNDMIEWAQDSLSESEIGAFNSSLTDNAKTEFAIQGLAARYRAEKGPSLIRGSSSPSSSAGFSSKAEMTQAMSNPQYARDPAFRADVQRKVALSSF